jgi:hypothetical protein
MSCAKRRVLTPVSAIMLKTRGLLGFLRDAAAGAAQLDTRAPRLQRFLEGPPG